MNAWEKIIEWLRPDEAARQAIATVLGWALGVVILYAAAVYANTEYPWLYERLEERRNANLTRKMLREMRARDCDELCRVCRQDQPMPTERRVFIQEKYAPPKSGGEQP